MPQKYLTLSTRSLNIPALRAFFPERSIFGRYIPFLNTSADVYVGWGRKKSGRKAIKLAKKHGKDLVLLEDGFFRSLGPRHISKHPLSLIVDDVGIYYDASEPSGLENLLNEGHTLTSEARARAESAMAFVREHRISKYNHAPEHDFAALGLSGQNEKIILVVDQTWRDASIAGALADDQSFARMLRAAIDENPESEIVLKVHPETVAGKKRGYLVEAAAQLPQKVRNKLHIVSVDVNPYALLEHVGIVYTVSSQLGFEALIAGKRVRCFGMPFYAGWGATEDELTCARRQANRDAAEIFAGACFSYCRYYDPFTGDETTFEAVAEILALQKHHNDENRVPAACLYFSRWKRPAIDRFLGSTVEKPRYFDSETAAINYARKNRGRVFGWSSRIPDDLAPQCEAAGVPLVRVEDGFIRSSGLGANLTLPCSLSFDDTGIYYDSTRPSRMENLLENADIDDALVERAENLVDEIRATGISKYNLKSTDAVQALDDAIMAARQAGRVIVAVPGQVGDDASVRLGGSPVPANIDLLRRVRELRPDAFIVFKPHPDIVAGQRAGHVPEVEALKYADIVEIGIGIIELVERSDEIHVNTSLTGFEALLRGKSVHCHGLPFYAGWGLTTDYVNCDRRSRRRTLAELAAVALILYPQYLDPVTGLHCTPEQLVSRLQSSPKRGLTRESALSGAWSVFGQIRKVFAQ